MKILQINLFYKKGSTGKIVEEIHQGCLSYGIDSYVAYALGNHNESNTFKFSSKFWSRFYTYLSALTGKQYTYSFFETFKLVSYIKRLTPDIVNIHAININTVNKYKLLEFLKKNNIKTIITFHSEIFYTGGCSHAYDCDKWMTGCGKCPNLWESTHSLFFDYTAFFWKKYKNIYYNFNDLKGIVCVSNWLKSRAVKSPFFLSKQINVIENGIDTSNVYKPRIFDLDIDNKIENKTIILHVTPSFKSNLKGGKYVNQVIDILDKDKFFFIIIGFDTNEKLPENVLTIKSIDDPIVLSKYYSLADLTLLTSKAETFSMVTAESLSCGTPIVGFKCGAPEEIAIPEYSIFVDYGSVNLLVDAIFKSITLHKKRINFQEISFKAQEKFDKNIMIKKYIEYYNSLC
jgi:putative colanic acid biosynthesis glycosyltransferase